MICRKGDWPLQETTSDEDTNGEIQSKVLDKADQRPQHAMLKDAQFSLKQGRLEISSQVQSLSCGVRYWMVCRIR